MGHVNWGLPLAFDLFFAGLGASAFMLAVMVDLAKDKRFRTINTVGAIVAPWPVILGVLLLVIDLGNPHRFWEMIFRRGEGFLMFGTGSPMSWGVWFLTIFVILSLIYLVVTILTLPFPRGGVVKKVFGIIGMPFALLVTVYPGVLLAGSPPYKVWSTFVLPIVFVASAIATGIATVIFIMVLPRAFRIAGKANLSIPKLERLNSGVIVLQLVAIIVFILAKVSSEQMKMLIGSANYGILWWLFVIVLGSVVPIIYGFTGKTEKPQASLIISALVLLGGFFMRYTILMAGQML